MHRASISIAKLTHKHFFCLQFDKHWLVCVCMLFLAWIPFPLTLFIVSADCNRLAKSLNFQYELLCNSMWMNGHWKYDSLEFILIVIEFCNKFWSSVTFTPTDYKSSHTNTMYRVVGCFLCFVGTAFSFLVLFGSYHIGMPAPCLYSSPHTHTQISSREEEGREREIERRQHKSVY